MTKLTTGLTALALALGISASAANALTTINFSTVVTESTDVNFDPGAAFLGDTGSGSITFDETMGTSFSFGDLTFSLTMFGQTFSSSDDEFDSAEYDSVTGDLFFSVSETSLFNQTDITLAGLDSFQFVSAITPVLGGGNEIDVAVQEGDFCATNCNLAPIPLPATLPLALAGMGLIGWVARRKA